MCRNVIAVLNDAPQGLKTIFVEMSSLKVILESVKFLIENHGPAGLTELNGPTGPIEGCQQTLSKLEAVLPKQRDLSEAGIRDKLRSALAMTFQEPKIRRLLHEVIGYKSTISVVINGEVL